VRRPRRRLTSIGRPESGKLRALVQSARRTTAARSTSVPRDLHVEQRRVSTKSASGTHSPVTVPGLTAGKKVPVLGDRDQRGGGNRGHGRPCRPASRQLAAATRARVGGTRIAACRSRTFSESTSPVHGGWRASCWSAAGQRRGRSSPEAPLSRATERDRPRRPAMCRRRPRRIGVRRERDEA